MVWAISRDETEHLNLFAGTVPGADGERETILTRDELRDARQDVGRERAMVMVGAVVDLLGDPPARPTWVLVRTGERTARLWSALTATERRWVTTRRPIDEAAALLGLTLGLDEVQGRAQIAVQKQSQPDENFVPEGPSLEWRSLEPPLQFIEASWRDAVDLAFLS
jgi:hypothetical protein